MTIDPIPAYPSIAFAWGTTINGKDYGEVIFMQIKDLKCLDTNQIADEIWKAHEAQKPTA